MECYVDGVHVDPVYVAVWGLTPMSAATAWPAPPQGWRDGRCLAMSVRHWAPGKLIELTPS